MNEVNELFTKENVEKIYVPDIVKDDLLSIIEEKLRKAGCIQGKGSGFNA